MHFDKKKTFITTLVTQIVTGCCYSVHMISCGESTLFPKKEVWNENGCTGTSFLICFC